MSAFALWALASSGDHAAAVDRIRRLWGSMLDAGARSFWEEFDGSGESPYANVRPPVRQEPVPPWASGPAMLLPDTVLGLRPIANGWMEFEVDPHLGDLTWAGAVVPTADGEICVIANGDGVSVDIPEGSTLIRDHRSYPGPDQVSW